LFFEVVVLVLDLRAVPRPEPSADIMWPLRVWRVLRGEVESGLLLTGAGLVLLRPWGFGSSLRWAFCSGVGECLGSDTPSLPIGRVDEEREDEPDGFMSAMMVLRMVMSSGGWTPGRNEDTDRQVFPSIPPGSHLNHT